MRLQDKVIVVTGAAQGIGEAYAKGLAAEGATVVVADLNAGAGEQVAKQIEADGGTAMFVPCDVSSAESADRAGRDRRRRRTAASTGWSTTPRSTATWSSTCSSRVDWDYYRKFMSVNMDGALVMTRAVYPSMQKRGGGSIVNQSSTAAYLYSGFYGLAKVGVNGLTQQLAHELGGMNIRVNAIAPARPTPRRPAPRPATRRRRW